MPSRNGKLFTNGRNQAVRIPREFEHPGEDAVMRKHGARLTIEPRQRTSLLALLKTLSPIGEDFDAIEDVPLDAVMTIVDTAIGISENARSAR